VYTFIYKRIDIWTTEEKNPERKELHDLCKNYDLDPKEIEPLLKGDVVLSLRSLALCIKGACDLAIASHREFVGKSEHITFEIEHMTKLLNKPN
jgi:hypothetical protein